MKKRFRLAAAVSLAALLIVAAVAVAATPKSGSWKAPKGKVQRGYDLKFKVAKGGKKITKIAGHVLEECSGESTSDVTTFAPDSSWKVKNGKFSGRHKEKSGGVTVYFTFEGKFTSSTKVKGKLREESIIAGATCDTHKLKFTAKKS